MSSGALSLVERPLRTNTRRETVEIFSRHLSGLFALKFKLPCNCNQGYIFPSGMLTNAETLVSHLFRGVREIRAFRPGDPVISENGKEKAC
jgi:hypothetical protein